MYYLIIIIIILIWLAAVYLINKPAVSSFTPIQQNFLNKLNPVLEKINAIINDPSYSKMMVSIPGQTLLSVGSSGKLIADVTSSGSIDNTKIPEVLSKANELIPLLTNAIKLVEKSEGVYNSQQLEAFVNYYSNILNNTQIVVKYLSNLK